jgi:hypothetical protein
MIITVSASLWCFAARRGAKVMAHSLGEQCNAAAGHHRDALRVSLSTPTDCVPPLDKGMTIVGEARLAVNVDKLTEPAIIMLKDYLPVYKHTAYNYPIVYGNFDHVTH